MQLRAILTCATLTLGCACDASPSRPGPAEAAAPPLRLGGDTPGEAVKQFIMAYKTGDLELLVKLAPPKMIEELGDAGARAMFQRTIDETRTHGGGFVDVVVVNEETIDDTVKVSYTLVYKDITDQSSCVVERRDGRWYVVDF